MEASSNAFSHRIVSDSDWYNRTELRENPQPDWRFSHHHLHLHPPTSDVHEVGGRPIRSQVASQVSEWNNHHKWKLMWTQQTNSHTRTPKHILSEDTKPLYERPTISFFHAVDNTLASHPWIFLTKLLHIPSLCLSFLPQDHRQVGEGTAGGDHDSGCAWGRLFHRHLRLRCRCYFLQ